MLRLVEAGRLALDTRVDTLLPAEELAGLFRDDAAAPTVLDLLQHRSGAADYFEGRRGASVMKAVLAHPELPWTPAELLDFTRERLRPVGRPGERFHYSDTGFVLLGRIIEELDGRAYHEAVHAHIIDPLELTRSFLPRRDRPRRRQLRPGARVDRPPRAEHRPGAQLRLGGRRDRVDDGRPDHLQ